MSNENICPICGESSYKDIIDFICPNNHIWHYCQEHETPVVTSLIGEKSRFPYTGCSCYLDCLNPKSYDDKCESEMNECNDKCCDKTITINIITPNGTSTIVDNNGECKCFKTNQGFTPDFAQKDFNRQLDDEQSKSSYIMPSVINMANNIDEELANKEKLDKEKIEKYLGITLAAAAKNKEAKRPSLQDLPFWLDKKYSKYWVKFCKHTSSSDGKTPLERCESLTDTNAAWAYISRHFKNWINLNHPKLVISNRSSNAENVAPKSNKSIDKNIVDKKDTNYSQNRFLVAVRKANAEIPKITNALIGAGFIKSVGKECIKQENVICTVGGSFSILTYREIKPTDKFAWTSTKFRQFLKDNQYYNTNTTIKNAFVKQISGILQIAVGQKDDGTPYIGSHYILSRNIIADALNLSKDDVKSEIVKPLLFKHFKSITGATTPRTKKSK